MAHALNTSVAEAMELGTELGTELVALLLLLLALLLLKSKFACAVAYRRRVVLSIRWLALLALLTLLTLLSLLVLLALLALLTQLLLKSVARCCLQPAVDKSV